MRFCRYFLIILTIVIGSAPLLAKKGKKKKKKKKVEIDMSIKCHEGYEGDASHKVHNIMSNMKFRLTRECFERRERINTAMKKKINSVQCSIYPKGMVILWAKEENLDRFVHPILYPQQELEGQVVGALGHACIIKMKKL